MSVSRPIKNILALLICLLFVQTGFARQNDKLLFGQESDKIPFHLGFGVGLHFQELSLKNSGYETSTGEQWVVDNNSYSPGFNLCVLGDLRLSSFFNLRLSPGLMFGSLNLAMRNLDGDGFKTMGLNTVYLTCPVDLKYSAVRYHNVRPYLIGGLMPAFDVSRNRGELIALKRFDMMASVGLGCQIYFPYFKLNPELKFCFGFTDAIRHDRPDLPDDEDSLKFTRSIKRGTSSMIILIFYFE